MTIIAKTNDGKYIVEIDKYDLRYITGKDTSTEYKPQEEVEVHDRWEILIKFFSGKETVAKAVKEVDELKTFLLNGMKTFKHIDELKLKKGK